MIGVYKITCINNNKIYIGSSCNIEMRWYRHKSNFKYNKANQNIQNSFNKYGLSSFKFEVIEECDVADLIEKEQYYANEYKNNGIKLFNIGDFVDNPTRGIKLSPERLQKLKINSICDKNPSFGKIWVHKNEEVKYIKKEELPFYEKDGYIKGLSKSHKTNISQRQKEIGREMSESNKKKLIEVNKKPKTREHKLNLSKSRIEFCGVKILCIETEETFNSLKEAADNFNTNYQGIRQAILRNGTCCKYHFKKTE